MRLLAEEQVRSVLTEARQAYLAVDARQGPHVTPELYGLVDDYLGMWVATSTVKAKVLRRSGRVGVLVRTATGVVVIRGSGEVLDPLRPPLNPGRLVGAGRLTVNFTLRNAADLVAFGRDTLAGATGFPPARRVMIVVRPDRASSIESFANDVVVGLSGTAGPLAVPGRWLGDGRVELPAEVEALDAMADGPVSVTSDEYVAPGPAAKRGVLLRGDGHFEHEDGRLIVTVDAARRTEWDGVRTSTEPATRALRPDRQA